MKKYIFIISVCAMGHSYGINSMQEAGQQLASLYKTFNDIKKITTPNTTQEMKLNNAFLNKWHRTIFDVTAYAINKSKNIMGQDFNLIATATFIRDINTDTMNVWQNIQNNKAFLKTNESYRQSLEHNIQAINKNCDKALTSLSKKHITLSKQDAQATLKLTINFLQKINLEIKKLLDNIATSL